MNLIVICVLAVASMSLLPSQVDGGPQSTDVKTPVAAAAAPSLSEIWQEDDREVLIRNVRGAKNNKDAQTGTASGKKGGKNHRKNGGKPKDGGVHHNHRSHQNKQAKQKQTKNNPIPTTPVDENNRKTHFCFYFSLICFFRHFLMTQPPKKPITAAYSEL